MPEDQLTSLEKGARNLLVNCAQCQPGQRLLLVFETEDDGYYGASLMSGIQHVAEGLGLTVEPYGVPLTRDAMDPDARLAAKMDGADRTIFLARLGDQVRFRPKGASSAQIISYALDTKMLASPFGTVDYAAFDRLRHLIDDAIADAQDIRVTCPAGTNFRGGPSHLLGEPQDVTRKRFPVSVYTPVPAGRFSGRIAQNGFLTGTGSNYYTPWTCGLEETLFVDFEGNRITGFSGSDKDVAAATAHYERVGKAYGLDTYYVHSWHGGIHPGCAYDDVAAQHMERWSGGAFGNPRLMHFHTCGDYPPGEISLNVLDPTIKIDGIAVWENGVLHPKRVRGGAELMAKFPEMAAVFRNPSTQVGQSPCGALRYF